MSTLRIGGTGLCKSGVIRMSTYLHRNWGGEFENVAILIVIAVNEDSYREVLSAAEGMKEDKAS